MARRVISCIDKRKMPTKEQVREQANQWIEQFEKDNKHLFINNEKENNNDNI